MKKVYYEVLEYNNGILLNMYYYATEDILKNKSNAERCYKSKVKATMQGSSSFSYELVLTVVEDLQTKRYILNQENTNYHQVESSILSALTGKEINVPEWAVREEYLLHEMA